MSTHSQFTLLSLRSYLFFGGVAFSLNFIWEAWHGVYLYDATNSAWMMGLDSPRAFVHLITYCSFIDMSLLLAVIVGLAWLLGDSDWYSSLNRQKMVYFIGSTFIIAAVIEYKAVHIFHQWQYSQLMPTIFGLGLSPLVQLAITGVVALQIQRNLCIKE